MNKHNGDRFMMSPVTLAMKSRFLLLGTLIAVLSSRIFADDPPYENCLSSYSYKAGSTFQNNLNLLLNHLPSNASTSSYYQAIVGDEPDRVYGNFMCYTYFPTQNCLPCVSQATEAIKAAFDPSQQKYSIGKRNLANADSVYGFVQCTQDLTGNDCERCLQNATTVIQNCCYYYIGARVLTESCYLPSKRKSKSKKVLAIVVVSIAAGILSCFAALLVRLEGFAMTSKCVTLPLY